MLTGFFAGMCAIGSAQNATFKDLLQYYQSAKNFNGVVLVATNSHIDYLDAAGLSSRQSGTTLNSKSKFKIASVTKTFTAVLILQLVEKGKLDLHAPIGKYLPDYTGEGKNKITIENLLTYSSGLPNCESYVGDAIYSSPISRDSFIFKYCSGPLDTVPGTAFSYDNGDYVLLGKIAEQAGGRPFDKLLQENILDPLGMVNTGVLRSSDIVTGLVQAYTYDDSTHAFSADKPYYIDNFFSAGAMYSTAEDLLKFDQGIFTHQLLKKATVDLMLTPHPALGNVGLAFWIAEKYGPIKTKFAYRPGGIYGSSANWIHVIDSNRSIIVLSNTNATDLFGMSQQLNAVATHAPVAFPVTATKNQPAFDATALAGTWTLDLRPSPNSEAYLKDFILTPGPGKTFSGQFYGSPFTGGQFLTVWPVQYFAFHTSDQANDYYHSGFIDGNTISGVSYSASRQFLSHWTGTKKKP